LRAVAFYNALPENGAGQADPGGGHGAGEGAALHFQASGAGPAIIAATLAILATITSNPTSADPSADLVTEALLLDTIATANTDLGVPRLRRVGCSAGSLRSVGVPTKPLHPLTRGRSLRSASN